MRKLLPAPFARGALALLAFATAATIATTAREAAAQQPALQQLPPPSPSQQPYPQQYPQPPAPPPPPYTAQQQAPPPRATCPDATACEAACACEKHCCHHGHCRCGKTPSVELSVVGVRPSYTHVSTGTVSEGAIGVAFAGSAESYALNGTTHGSMDFALGGGQAGFEGTLGGTVDLGYRIPVTADHGPFGRIGFDGRLQGNDLLYFSMVELPRFSLGYQYTHDKTVAEIGGRTGYVLTGLYDPAEDGRRRLRGWEWGASAAAQVEFLRLTVSAMRIEARTTLDGSPVDVVRGQLCGVSGRLGVCFDAALFSGNAEMRANSGGVHSTTSTNVGLTLGFAGW